MRNRVPSFMAAKEIQCPKCGRIERANVDPERAVLCSFCLMQKVLAVERQEREVGDVVQTGKARPRPVAFRERKPAKTCERCGESFRGRSNRQRFCERCQKWARNEYQRKLMSDRRNKESLVSI